MGRLFYGESFHQFGPRRLASYIRNTGIWTRVAVAIAIGFLLFFTVFWIVAARMADDNFDQIVRERLTLARMAAGEIDGYLSQAFNELEKAVNFALFDPQAPNLTGERHVLAHTYGQVGEFTRGIYFADADGELVLVEPSDTDFVTDNPVTRAHMLEVVQTGQRGISDVFIDPRTGTPTIAMTVPIRDDEGSLMAVFGGLVDVSGPDIRRPIEQALQLGESSHAEVFDADGMVVASTFPETALGPGDHLEFYLTMMALGEAGVELVGHGEHEEDSDEQHIMAFAPLTEIDWGVAVGGSAEETLAPARALRLRLAILAVATLMTILGATLVGTRYLMRPIRILAGNAGTLAKGDLTVPIALSGGREMAALAESLDEMRQKLRESFEALRRSNLDLESRVEERTRDLQRAMEDLGELRAVRKLDRLKTEFISSISHELRTPLGFITGYVTTLLRKDITHSEATRQEFLEVIGEEADKLKDLVEDLLDTARIQAGSFAVETSPMDVVELARQVVERMQPVADGRSLESNFDPLTPAVEGDPRRLEQVLRNLLTNAVKFSPADSPVTVAGGRKNGKVEVRVSDRGRGIPDGEVGKVFDAFYRVPGPARGNSDGAGLGLTISKAIVEAHGGNLWVESTEGEGSVFCFTLRIAGESG